LHVERLKEFAGFWKIFEAVFVGIRSLLENNESCCSEEYRGHTGRSYRFLKGITDLDSFSAPPFCHFCAVNVLRSAEDS
jgi:hypothetical protein